MALNYTKPSTPDEIEFYSMSTTLPDGTWIVIKNGKTVTVDPTQEGCLRKAADRITFPAFVAQVGNYPPVEYVYEHDTAK